MNTLLRAAHLRKKRCSQDRRHPLDIKRHVPKRAPVANFIMRIGESWYRISCHGRPDAAARVEITKQRDKLEEETRLRQIEALEKNEKLRKENEIADRLRGHVAEQDREKENKRLGEHLHARHISPVIAAMAAALSFGMPLPASRLIRRRDRGR